MPDNMNNTAVLLFMVAKPGIKLFNIATSKSQPTNPRQPIPTTKIAIPWERALNREVELTFTNAEVLAVFIYIFSQAREQDNRLAISE
jgi:hypothetical protein